jgi:group I intron endonuclease
MGVYRIRNMVNGRSYVAASNDIRARFNRHRMSLKTNNESVKALLADWNEFGENAFEFETLDSLEPLDRPGAGLTYDPMDDLKVLEALWLEKLQPYEPEGYNRVIIER